VWQDWLDGYELETYVHYKMLSSGRPVTEVGGCRRRCRGNNPSKEGEMKCSLSSR
jgi:hypothetical protein